MEPLNANSQSFSSSNSEESGIPRPERGVLTRHKRGTGNRGNHEKKVAREAAAISDIMKKSLFPDENDHNSHSETHSRSEGRSHRLRRKKISTEEVRKQFPISQVINLLKDLDEKNPKFTYFASQLSAIMPILSPKIVEGELIKFKRLEFLSALSGLNVDTKKFIENLVKFYLMSRQGDDFYRITKLVEARSYISKEYQEWYDKVVFETLSSQARNLYFRALSKAVSGSWTSRDITLSSYEEILIQDPNPIETFIENRKLISEPSKCLEITSTLAQSGNADLFIHYMQELFNILLARQAPLTEIRLATKQFLEVIKYPSLNDGKTIFDKISALKNALKSLVIRADQKTIEDFINQIIYEDGSTQIIQALIDDLMKRFEKGELSIQDLAVEHGRMKDYSIITAGRRDAPISLQLDIAVVEFLEPDDNFHFAKGVFDRDKEFGKEWLKEFIKRLQMEVKWIPVFKFALQYEHENSDRGEGPLRGGTCAATMFALTLASSCSELGRILFEEITKILAPNEKTALQYIFSDLFVNKTKLADFQNPKVIALNEERFCTVIDKLLEEIFTLQIPAEAIEILNLTERSLRGSQHSKWEILSDLWYLRGINANLTAMISSIPTTYKFQLEDPIHTVLKQFISVLVKMPLHDGYDNLQENNPRRQLHKKFHKPLLANFKKQLKDT